MQAIIVRQQAHGVEVDSSAYAGYLERAASEMPARALEFARLSWLAQDTTTINMRGACFDGMDVTDASHAPSAPGIKLTLELRRGGSCWRLFYNEVENYTLSMRPCEGDDHWELLVDELSVQEEDSLLRHELIFNHICYVIICRMFDFDVQAESACFAHEGSASCLTTPL